MKQILIAYVLGTVLAQIVMSICITYCTIYFNSPKLLWFLLLPILISPSIKDVEITKEKGNV